MAEPGGNGGMYLMIGGVVILAIIFGYIGVTRGVGFQSGPNSMFQGTNPEVDTGPGETPGFNDGQP